MRHIGFSTGAVAFGDFQKAVTILNTQSFDSIELSALRLSEIEPLVMAIPSLDLARYRYVSLHAPSSFTDDEERWLVDLLLANVPQDWKIVLHPDTLHDFSLWRKFGKRLAIENMDRRKPVGRSLAELLTIFAKLPEASLCFDIGHARQCDSSMTEAFLILTALRNRLVHLHASEVNSESRHERISYGAMLAFRQVASLIPKEIPVIIESRVDPENLVAEADLAQQALCAGPIVTNHHNAYFSVA